MTRNDVKPTTIQRDLAKLPIALAPLIERPQWCTWRWTQKPDGSWQKPPFQATRPEQHASTNDPNTWTDYATALAAVQAGHADGLSYILTKDDPFGAIDLDHCRDKLCSIDVWAQNFMQAAVDTYQEVTPSGGGVRIWGFVDGDSDPLNRKFTLEIDGKKIAAELFRRTNKALTITGYRLNTVQQLTNIDNVFDWAIVWGERRKAAAATATAAIAAAASTASIRSSRLYVKVRRRGKIALTSFTPSWGTMSAAAGRSIVSSNTCSNIQMG